jgi:putative ABC transport system ATP-binding protein
MLVQCQQLSVVYGSGKNTVRPFTSVTFDVGRGESVAVTGPSGSGKSTVLRLIAGLQQPYSGSIRINTTKVTPKNAAEVRRKQIGMVYQDYRLIPFLTVVENVVLPLELMRIAGVGPSDVDSLLKSLGLTRLRDRACHSLSGGEQQRVGIARALITKPALLLADEPTGALDHAASSEIAQTFRKLAEDRGVSVMVATHDPEVASAMDRVLTFDSGTLAAATS